MQTIQTALHCRSKLRQLLPHPFQLDFCRNEAVENTGSADAVGQDEKEARSFFYFLDSDGDGFITAKDMLNS